MTDNFFEHKLAENNQELHNTLELIFFPVFGPDWSVLRFDKRIREDFRNAAGARDSSIRNGHLDKLVEYVTSLSDDEDKELYKNVIQFLEKPCWY